MNRSQDRSYVLQWPELLRWDLKSARAAAFRAAHPGFRPLGEFIEESTEIVHPSREPSHNWPVFGVSNKGGLVSAISNWARLSIHHTNGSGKIGSSTIRLARTLDLSVVFQIPEKIKPHILTILKDAAIGF